MPVPERFGVTLEHGDLVEVTITGRVEGIRASGIYLAHEASDRIGTIPYDITSKIVITATATLPDAHTFAAGDLVASDADLDHPYVRTRQADGSWLTPKGFRSSVTDSYMSARVEAGEFWRVDASNPDRPVAYVVEEKHTVDYYRTLANLGAETCSYKSTCGPVSGGTLTMTSGSPGLEDWERELLSSPSLVTLPEVDATPRFKVGAVYYHPTYPGTHWTREAGGWRSHEVRFSRGLRFFSDGSPYLGASWLDGLVPVAS